MKFKDLRSIQTLLKEYGMSPGPSTPVGQQSSGSIAKANVTQSPTLKKAPVSPSTSKAKADSKQPTMAVAKAGDLKKDFVFPDDKGNTLKIVSPAGHKTSIPNDNEDLVVAVNSKDEPVVFDKDADIAFPEMEEGKLGDFVKRARNKSLGKLKKSGGLRRLGRKSLKENPEELFEINFNNKDVIQASLDAPIKCGFEAETVWEGLSYATDDPDNLTFNELVDEYNDASYNEDYVREYYWEWVTDTARSDFMPDLVDKFEDENYDDYDYRMEFAGDNIDSETIEEYKEEFKEENPEEYKNRIEDGWDEDNWTSELIDEQYESDFRDYLRDIAWDDDDLREQSEADCEEEYDIDWWVSDQYGSAAGAFREIADVYFDTENSEVESIAETLHNWIRKKSAFSEYPETGGYGDTEGYDRWAVETDGSIEGSGAKGEIISPVYGNPREMLEEMKSLFEYFEDNDVDTNRSTGLHITMSWDGKDNTETNKIKAIVLSGVDHVMTMFGRKGNSYTKARMPDLKKAMQKLKDGSDVNKSLKQIEDILSNAISRERTMAINFKGNDERTGNKMIEFRAAGGDDYHRDISKIVKTVVRYSATMQGAHSEEHQRDYVRALFKLINRLDDLSPEEIERTKQGDFDDHPLVLLFQSMLGKNDFLEGVREIYRALEYLEQYNKLNEPDAQKKWDSKWAKFKKVTGKGKEDYDVKEGITEAPNSGVEDAGSIPAMIRPSLDSPEIEARKALSQAQKNFKVAMGRLAHDVSVNLNRSYINAKSISILRKAVKDFQLSEEQVANSLVSPKIIQQINFTNPDARESMELKHKLIAKGISRLLKRENIVKDKYFLKSALAEKITDRLWNFIHADNVSESQVKKVLDLFLKAKYDDVTGDDATRSQKEIEAIYKHITSSDIREYSDFVGGLQRGGHLAGGYDALLPEGGAFSKDALDKIYNFLSKFPEYPHPVTPKHSTIKYGSDDDYIENFLKQLSIKMRTRLKAFKSLEQTNLAKYFDTSEKIGKLVKQAYQDLKITHGRQDLGKVYDNLVGTDIENEKDGRIFLAIDTDREEYFVSKMETLLDKIARRDYSTENGGYYYVDLVGDFFDNIRSMLDRYSRNKSQNPSHYKFTPIPELVKERMNTIKKFFKGMDAIATKDLGFDSMSELIKRKSDITKHEKGWKKTHGPKHALEVPGFEFGGSNYVRKDVADEILRNQMSANSIASYMNFDKSKYLSAYNSAINMPNSHYYMALEASEQKKSGKYKGTWREKVGQAILKEFYSTYKVSFETFENEYMDVIDNEQALVKKLAEKDIVITKELGDGREGMKGLGDVPLLPRDEINGPFGEPFEISSAGAWHVNNPELSKKAKAKAEKELQSVDIQIPIQADVTGYADDHSAKITAEADYKQLAKYLKIEPGVNDQGVELLRKTVYMYDGNAQGTYAAEGIGMERFVDAVKKAKKYIEDNYKVSGGNYFRDDDYIGSRLGGSEEIEYIRDRYERLDQMMRVGIEKYIQKNSLNKLLSFLNDPTPSEEVKKELLLYMVRNAGYGDVPDFDTILKNTKAKVDKIINTPPENEYDTDYEKARDYHALFNKWMQEGTINKYIAVGHVNDLVAFLNNPRNSSEKKSAMLDAIKYNKDNGGVPLTWDLALQLMKNKMESVFSKFNKLTLEEQLLLVEQSEVLEKWSKKQKKSVNCNNPKGFSQKAHCAGRKARQAGKTTQSKSVSEGAVPDNSVIRIVNKLLAGPMPASDLRKQMDAYFAIPDPKMLTDFRARRAEGGDDACLRPVLRHYVKTQLNPLTQKSINLNESIIKENLEIKDKERLDYIVNTLKNNPEFIKKVFRYIKVDPDHDGKIDPEELLSKEKTKPETDHLATKEILKAFINALMNTPGDLDDLETFLSTYGKVSYIDSKKLMSGKSTWSEWLLGSQDVSKEFIENLYINLFNFTPNVLNSDRGPGEIGLALLSPNIKIASVGDLSIDGVEVEVKGERSVGGGRLRNSNADFGVPQMDKIFNKYNVPQELRITDVSGNAMPQKTHFLDVAKKLEEFKPGVGKEYIKEFINGIYIHADQNLKNQLVNKSLNLSYAENFLEISKIAFNNYVNILKGKGFEDLLMINLPYKNSLAFKASDIDQYIDQFKFSSLDFGDTRNGGAIQVSMKK